MGMRYKQIAIKIVAAMSLLLLLSLLKLGSDLKIVAKQASLIIKHKIA
jgi:hypothetical protein